MSHKCSSYWRLVEKLMIWGHTSFAFHLGLLLMWDFGQALSYLWESIYISLRSNDIFFKYLRGLNSISNRYSKLQSYVTVLAEGEQNLECHYNGQEWAQTHHPWYLWGVLWPARQWTNWPGVPIRDKGVEHSLAEKFSSRE